MLPLEIKVDYKRRWRVSGAATYTKILNARVRGFGKHRFDGYTTAQQHEQVAFSNAKRRSNAMNSVYRTELRIEKGEPVANPFASV